MSEPAAALRFPLIRRVDELWHRGERLVCGVMFLVMALLVFGSVVQEAFGTRREWQDVAVLFVVVWAAVMTRTVREGERRPTVVRALVYAAIATAAIAAGVIGLCRLFAGHSIMIQKLGLVMMIWVALLGASMATYERSHLSLEMGEKLWPARLLPWVKALAHGVTSAFCAGAFLLSVRLVQSQRHLGITIDDAAWLSTWQAFLVVPYAFGAMAVRFFAQAVTAATRTSAPVEEQLPS